MTRRKNWRGALFGWLIFTGAYGFGLTVYPQPERPWHFFWLAVFGVGVIGSQWAKP